MEMSFFWKLRNAWWTLKGGFAAGAPSGEQAARRAADPGLVHVPGFAPVRFHDHSFDRSTDSVDVVVLAHGDLPALEGCLGALLRHARPPYKLFLADPGVSPAVRNWLEAFGREQGAALVSGANAFRKARDAGASRHVLLLDGRARVAADVLDRLRERARARFEGKRVLYVLPVLERGGGSNVVLSEARAMTRMGVEARVFNLAGHRSVFEKSYPAPGVPIVYGRESDLVEAAEEFDAVIATAHYSVPWMAPLAKLSRPPVPGYCIQDYEPLFYAEGSEDRKRAFSSYGLVPGMRRFSKSAWNADEVVARTGLDCALVSASFDAEVFRPRLPEPAASPVRIAAMVRPSTPRRQPGAENL